MAQAYNYFDGFSGDIGLGAHPSLHTNTHRVSLHNVQPVVTNTILANIAQIANGNGYTTDGEDAGNSFVRAGAVGTCAAAKITWTAGPAAMAAFRWMVYYSNQSATLVNPLIAWWEYGAAALTLGIGETVTWKPNSGDTGTVFTIGHP